jgi:hypothetical protein
MVLREVPKEGAAVKSSGALKKRHGGWHLAAERCRKLKEWTKGICGSQRKLAAACKGMTCRRGHGHKGYDWDNVVQETRKGWTFGRRCQPKLECSNGKGAATSEEREENRRQYRGMEKKTAAMTAKYGKW